MPKQLQPADGEDLTDSFYEPAPESARPLLDRSALERYAVCPRQARLIESGDVNTSSHIASVGQAIHDALGKTVTEYVEADNAIQYASELIGFAWMELTGARPDVQPEVLRAATKGFLYPWANMLLGKNCDNVIRWDGGEDDRSGQLAWDVMDVRLTSELDLLLTGPAPELVENHDYKTGHKLWSEYDVRDSFQFQLHAWLVFNNYPEVQGVRTVVWMTRLQKRTYATLFDRDRDLPTITTRIRSAVGEWAKWHDKPPEDCPAWPTIEKCGICDAAPLCLKSGMMQQRLTENPGRFVDAMVAVSAGLAVAQKMAAAHVDEHGEIVSEGGNAFGREKPKAERKANAALYKRKTD